MLATEGGSGRAPAATGDAPDADDGTAAALPDGAVDTVAAASAGPAATAELPDAGTSAAAEDAGFVDMPKASADDSSSIFIADCHCVAATAVGAVES